MRPDAALFLAGSQRALRPSAFTKRRTPAFRSVFDQMKDLRSAIFSVIAVSSLVLILAGLLGFSARQLSRPVTGLEAGVGYADITGPAAGVPMMGYAQASQLTAGVHTRLFARAFVFRDSAGNSVAYVNVDAAMVTQMVRLGVLRFKFGGTYTEKNVLMAATHTHSGPGGYHGYTLYALSTLGYAPDAFEAIVAGITTSIELAHRSFRPARLLYNEGELSDSSVNRSPTSYLLNPEAERARYPFDVDRMMQLVKLEDRATGKAFGMINWFPVHGTSLNGSNLLISGDNKGWAAQAFERFMDSGAALPGRHRFVAAFANGNEGDASPNTAGARCHGDGQPCDSRTSTCGGRAQDCGASGPGADAMDSARIIGMRQFERALSLFHSSTQELLVDSVGHAHQTVDMSSYRLMVDGRPVRTCKPAMGYSFAAGTTDGPGGFDFTQGDTGGNRFWDMVRGLLSQPSQQQVECQWPKPVLLNTGYLHFPTDWQPSIVETQILRLGPLAIVALPGEFTTMAGRRVRDAVQSAFVQSGWPNAKVVLTGLANSYASYVTTFEEYQAQRYEAASTIFGPHTLSAYVDQFTKLATSLATNESLDTGPSMLSLHGKVKRFSFVPPVVFDAAGISQNFGDVLVQPADAYSPGDTASARFRSAHPRNSNTMQGTSFLAVQRKTHAGTWETVCNDACVETRFHWKQTSAILGLSEALVEWDVPACVQPGAYRLLHSGRFKPVLPWEQPEQFTGATREFRVKNLDQEMGRSASYCPGDVIRCQFGSGCV